MILFDESHNEFCTITGSKKRRLYSTWKELIDPYGLIAVRSRKKLSERIEEAEAIVFAEPHSYFTLSETRALFDFVLQGGSLIFIGNHHNSPRYYSYGCNEILNVISNPFGIRFNNDEVLFSGENVVERFADHPTCDGLTFLHYWRGCSLTLLRIADSMAQTVAFGSRHDMSEVYRKAPVVAAVYEGEGKLFCLGDSSVWADPQEPLEDDNFAFAENVVKWALR